MRTDHYLLEKKKKWENEALHQTNLYSRRMKLPVNRHIESDQTKKILFSYSIHLSGHLEGVF
jgi:hypothetical protein